MCVLPGVSVSTLSDNFLILHVQCEDIKQKVGCPKNLFIDVHKCILFYYALYQLFSEWNRTRKCAFPLLHFLFAQGDLVLQCDYLFEALTKLSAGQQAALY